MLKRAFDIIAALFGVAMLAVPAAIVWLIVKSTSKGPALYWSDRVGKDNHLFQMPKFRTMMVGTPALPTHKLDKAQSYLTPPGAVLRKLSLDEIPQLWCILTGDMSLVGPRPALFNQEDLIAQRTGKVSISSRPASPAGRRSMVETNCRFPTRSRSMPRIFSAVHSC